MSVESTSLRMGHYLITGPEHPDGTGWNLCDTGLDGSRACGSCSGNYHSCQACIGNFRRLEDAQRIPILESAMAAQDAMIAHQMERAGLEPIHGWENVDRMADELVMMRQELESLLPIQDPIKGESGYCPFCAGVEPARPDAGGSGIYQGHAPTCLWDHIQGKRQREGLPRRSKPNG